ncbi:MAG: apolipoprotein N-acyltransferase [Desulfuromonadales bacterium]|nr:apolipoprotein N-acyltransferase [Desulfuromonadales bacterium]MBN2791060.1 apolipoprotein N-acyltransferase [Desulfuromonadales bacterium]
MSCLRRIDPSLVASALSGLLLAAAYPRPDLYPLAWVGLIPLLLVMQRRPFATGFTAGAVFFSVVLYWLNIVMTSYGGLQPLFSLLAYLFLITYLAVYVAAVTWLSCRLKDVLGLPYLVTVPFLWVACEFLRATLLTGFPWALLGYSQHPFSAAIQSADVTGVYGVSFLLVSVNCALAWLLSEPRKGLAWVGFGAVLLMTTSHLGYGLWRNGQPLDERAEKLRVALIQGNIDQAQKWVPENRQATIEIYRSLSVQALQEPADLLIWPEAATPFFVQDESDEALQVRSLAATLAVPLLFGSPAYQQLDDGRYEYFNSAFLLSAQGQTLGRSDKVHLVPFGEYVPLGRLLSFINKLVVGVGDFSPGKLRPLVLNNDRIGVLICYEAIFPSLARAYVRQGSRLLVNLTNDAWFGKSSAPYQHLAMVKFRAIENRIWLARAANTGISALISPSGKIVSDTPVFAALSLNGSVGLGSQATFYSRYGDVFACLCGLFSLVFLGVMLFSRKRSA